VDGAQYVPHAPIDVQALDIDFLAFSGHKMLGPTGIGVLWGKREILNSMPPFMGGGDMIREVHLRHSTWNELPWKFEAGTQAIAQAIGLAAAVDYLENVGMAAIHRYESQLTGYAMERLSEVEGLRMLGPSADKRGGLVAFTLGDIHPHDIAAMLDTMGIAVRAGHHCAQPIHEHFGIPASARASFYLYNTPAEVDALVAGLHKVVEMFAF
jgi:cysteine desulfurase / selenocysteine lyase